MMDRRFPENGKIVVVAPEVAVKLFDQDPDLAKRVYAQRGIEPTKGFVIDLDEARRKGLIS